MAVSALASSSNHESLSERQHKLALDYLAIQLAVRDRENLIKVLCQSSPDLLTSSIRSLIPPYDPIIRGLHQAVDLNGGVSDLEAFLNDLINVATVKGKNQDSNPPSVEDFCRLLQKHQGSSHRFIHQVLKNNKDLSQKYHEYAAHAAKQYRQSNERELDGNKPASTAAGEFTSHLETIVSNLSENDKSTVLAEVDQHARYLSALTQSSTTTMKTILQHLAEGKSGITRGPGMFLSRWQVLMDETPITPAQAEGPIRFGKSESVRDATKVDIDGVEKGGAIVREEMYMSPPDVSHTVHLLGPGFCNVLKGVGGY